MSGAGNARGSDLRAARLAFSVALLAVALLALAPRPIGLLSDELDHFAAFALLTVLAARAVPSLSGVVVLAAAMLAGAGLEMLQSLPAIGRTAELSDWISGALGSAGAVLAAKIVERIRT